MRFWKNLIVGGGKILKGNLDLVYKLYSINNNIIIIYIKVYKVLSGEVEDLWMKIVINFLKIKKKFIKECLYLL